MEPLLVATAGWTSSQAGAKDSPLKKGSYIQEVDNWKVPSARHIIRGGSWIFFFFFWCCLVNCLYIYTDAKIVFFYSLGVSVCLCVTIFFCRNGLISHFKYSTLFSVSLFSFIQFLLS